MGQAGFDRCLACRVLAGTCGEDLAENHLIDLCTIQTGLGQQLTNHCSTQVDGGNGGQGALETTDSRAGGGNNNNVLHGTYPHSHWIAPQRPALAMAQSHGW
ncbi:hypothetical protein D3C81_1337420 [compost metagenome]